jgi:hypothetical protein
MMSDTGSALQHHCTVFDGWRSISLSLYMTLSGYAVLVGVPVISTAWVNLLGFSEVEVGRVAGPNIAASILAFGYGYAGVFIMCAIAALTAMLIYASTYIRLKQTIPALADAS